MKNSIVSSHIQEDMMSMISPAEATQRKITVRIKSIEKCGAVIERLKSRTMCGLVLVVVEHRMKIDLEHRMR